MKRYLLSTLIVSMMSLIGFDQPLKVLHVTFHEGCQKDFEEVAGELNIELTSWFVQHLPEKFWNGMIIDNSIYNINAQQAQIIWERHKDFFATFDVIITSDTVPLSRIFLQNNWQKPLIIWACNRFDYYDMPTHNGSFPDQHYYDLIREATKKPNVFFVAYTPYETVYAQRKNIAWGDRIIKPLGKKEQSGPGNSFVPQTIKQADTLFIFPRLVKGRITNIQKECEKRGIATWSGTYNGPEDLKGFKGVIFFPYAFSNLALFENLQRGIVHFVPTIKFLRKLNYVRYDLVGNIEWSEWYFDEYKDVIQYFDSWDDLKRKITSINYPVLKKKIKSYGEQHRHTMLTRWKELFEQVHMLLI